MEQQYDFMNAIRGLWEILHSYKRNNSPEFTQKYGMIYRIIKLRKV